ncbi:hypothetical protein ASPCAL05086 [Aspergillus calidoustus]|uniref:Ecp2 effector protein domain-containing protein n=1 Tax=Aspergillus calidoustus TaxID=454130 RepID=A0A0U5FZW1_ASPCI|nr:hypothetical protein ASPCAL05086 [Aspergillus calidoustus]
MKLLTSLIVLSPLVLSAHAADCSEPDKEVYERAASEMMWSIRGWLCSNAWWQSITAGPQGAWCDNQGGIVGAYEGQFTIHGMQSQQQCWDTTEQIIRQCMKLDISAGTGPGQAKNLNGGTWTWGSVYAGGWFWAAHGEQCQNHVKRSGEHNETVEVGQSHSLRPNFTLADGTVLQAENLVTLDVTGDEPVLVKHERF